MKMHGENCIVEMHNEYYKVKMHNENCIVEMRNEYYKMKMHSENYKIKITKWKCIVKITRRTSTHIC
jgi:hypothetical protein